MAPPELKRIGSKTASLASAARSHDESTEDKEINAQINELVGLEERRLVTAWYLQHRCTPTQCEGIQPTPFASALLSQIESGVSKYDVKIDEPFFQYRDARSSALDEWTRNFLVRHQYEDALVLQICCGLDNRHLRMCAGKDVKWIDVDRPRIVGLRERLLPHPEGDYTMIAAVIGEDDDAWLRDIPADRPVLLIMENLLGYLEPAAGVRLMKQLMAHFPKGNLICDTVGSLAVTFTSLVPPLNKGNRDKAPLKWGMDDAKDLLELDSRLVLREQRFAHELMTVGRFSKGYPPIFGGWTPVISLLPKFKKGGQFLHFEF